MPPKQQPPSLEKALEMGNVELSDLKAKIRERLANGAAMSHQERQFVKKQFKETFNEDLYPDEEKAGKGADNDHEDSDDSLWNRIFHTSHAQVEAENALF